nr:MAG TPA: hypothetical protein [Caudoviricetes sp.]
MIFRRFSQSLQYSSTRYYLLIIPHNLFNSFDTLDRGSYPNSIVIIFCAYPKVVRSALPCNVKYFPHS